MENLVEVVRKYTKNVAHQMLPELFPSKLVFPPHSPPLKLTYFPYYVRNPDEIPVPSIQCDFFGIGVTCNDPIRCSHCLFISAVAATV